MGDRGQLLETSCDIYVVLLVSFVELLLQLLAASAAVHASRLTRLPHKSHPEAFLTISTKQSSNDCFLRWHRAVSYGVVCMLI